MLKSKRFKKKCQNPCRVIGFRKHIYKAKEKYRILKGRLSGYKREALLGDEEYRQKWVNLMSEKEFEEMKVFDVFNKQLNKLYEVRKQMPEGSDEAKEIDTMSQALRIDALQAISDISNE